MKQKVLHQGSCIPSLKKGYLYGFLLVTIAFFLASSPERGTLEEGAYTSLERAMKNPENVFSLSLKRRKLQSFPQEIFSFPNLKKLNLSGNRISQLPYHLGELKQLEILDLSNNKIQHLPESIGDIVQLKLLDLNRNRLTTLPSSIGKLSALEGLILWSNPIDTLPEEMALLNPTLKLLDMRAIIMTPDEQEYIKALLPDPIKRFDQACNCK